MAKRGKLEIIFDILTIIKENHNLIKPTPLLRQSNLSSNRYKEYFQLSDGIAKPSDSLNTRVIYAPDCERVKNTKIDFKLNYFTKDISLYERRYHEFLLKNDLNRLTTFTVRDNWTASVDWIYNRLQTDLSYDEIKLDNNSNSTMLYSISFDVSVLFFLVERNSSYPRILEYMVNINTVDLHNDVIG